ncbi:hypothetical protein COT47_03165 [Candidatus Woesearchaeota archaeon CG08_land_8_20_14_0_20_43_7]|nr:MAG: hypothetical protein COT47_03165 [Candidatus Woesearchaeota archaeon CG08_land_8_20_14_0_20_43_7]
MADAQFMKEMRWPEIETYLKDSDDDEIILPIGAIEEHGPHMPLCVDSDVAMALSRKVSEKLGIMVHPLYEYGLCTATAFYSGTFTADFDVYKAMIEEILERIHHHGFRKIYMIPGHLGSDHLAGFKVAAKEFLKDHEDADVFIIDPYSFLEGIFSDGDGHAGRDETSLMLHLHPEKVDMTKAIDEVPDDKDYSIRPKKRSKTGIFGFASKATAENGKKLFGEMVEGIIRTIRNLRSAK